MGNTVTVEELSTADLSTDPQLLKQLAPYGITSQDDMEQRFMGPYPTWATGPCVFDNSDRSHYLKIRHILGGKTSSTFPFGGIFQPDAFVAPIRPEYKIIYDYIFDHLELDEKWDASKVIAPYKYTHLGFSSAVEYALKKIYEDIGITSLVNPTAEDQILAVVIIIGDIYGRKTLEVYSSGLQKYIKHFVIDGDQLKNIQCFIRCASTYILK